MIFVEPSHYLIAAPELRTGWPSFLKITESNGTGMRVRPLPKLSQNSRVACAMSLGRIQTI